MDRLLATLVHLRTGLTYAALGVIYEVGSSTIGRAISSGGPLGFGSLVSRASTPMTCCRPLR
ncbi:transposase family protein [Streptomyces sp. NPDC050610]|uniref:transposase family protein n=1 Tax=Streptomyces sp. NPDC050610 TaxID=3157097 RepID=UPI00343EA248